jgi:hypothetical protein
LITAVAPFIFTTTADTMNATSAINHIDIEWLFRLRVAIARCGEMDLARWWNSNKQLGSARASVLKRYRVVNGAAVACGPQWVGQERARVAEFPHTILAGVSVVSSAVAA